MSAHCWRWIVSEDCVPVWDIWSINRGRWESRSTSTTNRERRMTAQKRRGECNATHRAFSRLFAQLKDLHARAHPRTHPGADRRTLRVELGADHRGERPLDQRYKSRRDHEVVRHEAHRPHERGDHRVAEEPGRDARLGRGRGAGSHARPHRGIKPDEEYPDNEIEDYEPGDLPSGGR